jgi:hypothetical protein
MANAVPNGTSQTKRAERISAKILAQGFLLNRPYAVNRRKSIKTRPSAIRSCREESERTRANSVSRVSTPISSTSAATARIPPGKP